MRIIALAITFTVLLAGCVTSVALPPTRVEQIKTLAVVVMPYDNVRVSHRGFTVFNNEGTSYDANEWGVAAMKMAALRHVLEPRFTLVEIPAPAVDQDEALDSSLDWRLKTIVAPAYAAAGVKADAILYVDTRREVAFYDSEWKFAGCGLYDVHVPLRDIYLTRVYCVGALHVVDPATMTTMASSYYATPDYLSALVEPVEDFDWSGTKLSDAQIAKAKRAIGALLDQYMPALVRNTGLVP
ncbi:MAG: hypothetical protein PHS60_06965 [Zavarzinia sp.]|nr:hypothetical protein [Zavarzinia sp.]